MTVEDRQWHYQQGYKDGKEDTIEEVEKMMKDFVSFENVDLFVQALRKLKEQNK
ncbi:MAG: hypothetical protein KBT27_13110 [Prevotellaceae bacterium]|nr:hypothetical protein [Candidatus Faecinaster equi]